MFHLHRLGNYIRVPLYLMLEMGYVSVAAVKFNFEGKKPGRKTQHKTRRPLPKWMAHEMVPFSVKSATINHIGDTYDGCASDGVLGWAVGCVEVLIIEGEGFFWIPRMKN